MHKGWQIAQICFVTLIWLGSPVYNLVNKKFGDPKHKRHGLTYVALTLWIAFGLGAGFCTYKVVTQQPEKAEMALFLGTIPLAQGVTNWVTLPLATNDTARLELAIRNLKPSVPAEALRAMVVLPHEVRRLSHMGWDKGTNSMVGDHNSFDYGNEKFESLSIPPVIMLYGNDMVKLPPIILEVLNPTYFTHVFYVRLSAKQADPHKYLIYATFRTYCPAPQSGFPLGEAL